MVVKGRIRIKEIATKLGLPEWWVEAVIIEYFPCRKYLQGKEIWLFNFDIVRDDQIETIASKKVVVSGAITLFHNIRLEHFGPRVIASLVGEPLVPLMAEIVPDGLVNRYYFPFYLNPIDVWDPKLGFNDLAIVFDDSRFYQWRIAEPCPVEGKPYAWWKSNLFAEELQELFRVNEQIREIKNAWYQRSIKDVGSSRKKLEELYEELEKIREPIRRKVLQYHYSKKGKAKEPSKYSPALVTANGRVIKLKPPNLPKVEPRDFSPPLLTLFDSLTIKDNQYNVRTYLAPLLYRAALKQLKLAKEAYEKRSLQHPSVVIPNEIEASAVCIICSHACLDAYINEIIDDHFPEYSDHLQRIPLMQKWLIVPFILSSKACFNPEKSPFKDFLRLNTWRNNAVHFKSKWQDLKKVEGITEKVGMAFATFNVSNAEHAVNIVKLMIEQICSKTGIPLPRWLYPSKVKGGWLDGLI